MKKRAAAMAAISILLCILVALCAPDTVSQQAEGDSVRTEQPTVLRPETQSISFEAEQPIGLTRPGGLRDTLSAAADYGTIFPYAARIVGWKADGTPVYRYAMADSGGELITNAVYTAVTRQTCDNSFVWLLTAQAEDGTTRVSCAAKDGSWVLGPFDGTITVEDNRIFVQRTENSTVSTVYNGDGKIMGQIMGTLSSYSDGVIVSSETRETGTVWFFNDAEKIVQTGFLTAEHVGAFSEGMATVQLSDTEWGFVNTSAEVTPTQAVWLDDTCGGYALAQDAADAYGVLEVTGETAISFTYENGTHCSRELPIYQLWTQADTCEVLNAATSQKLALPKDLDGQQLVALPKTYFAYTNAEGNTVVFDDLVSLELEPDAMFYEQGDDVLLSVSDTGYQIIDMSEDDCGKLHSFHYVAPREPAAAQDTVFTVENPETGRQGIGNVRGRTVLPAEYDSIYSVDGSYFAAIQGCWSGIVDSHGDWIVRTMLTGTE